jgi:copper resistance protein D
MTSSFPFSTVLLAIASDGAYALIVGLLLARYWLGRQARMTAHPAVPLPPVRPLLIGCTAILALAHAINPWFLAANMSGFTRWRDVTPLIPDILNGTHLGTLWYIDTAAILILLAAIVVPRQPSQNPTDRVPAIRLLANWTVIACLCSIGFVKAASGHAGGDGDFTFREVVQALHILATAVWAGAILISGLLVLPRMARLAQPGAVLLYGNQLSEAATGAVIIILASGIYAADRELNNSLSGLWSSAWGKVLVAKIVFVLIALSLGAYNRFRSLKKMNTAGDSVAFARAAMVEAIMIAIVVCLSGLLGTLAPVGSNL